MSPVLEVRSLTKSFGGLVAVDGVSFEVREGEILGLIGPNGSGKSTLFNCILGQLAPTSGEVRIGSRVITGIRPCELNRLGVGRTFQLLQVFPKLTVRENLILAGQEHRGSMWSRLVGPRDAGLGEAANRMIDFFRLSRLADEQAGSLSYGQQKLLDVAMAFMAGPRLVLLDEPAAGLPDEETGHLSAVIQKIPERYGALVILVDHDMTLVSACCETTAVLDFGKLIASGPTAEVLRNEHVMRAYLGTEEEL